MNTIDIWELMTTAQVSTALVLIAASLVYIAVKLSEIKRSSRSSK